MSLGPMSHVEFKKRPCRPVDIKGQGPLYSPPSKLLFHFKILQSFLHYYYSQNHDLFDGVDLWDLILCQIILRQFLQLIFMIILGKAGNLLVDGHNIEMIRSL